MLNPRYYLLALLFLIGPLSAVDVDPVVPEEVQDIPVDYEVQRYLECAKIGAYQELQAMLDNLVKNGTDIPAAKKIFKSLYDYVESCMTDGSSDRVASEFRAMDRESYLKMACRFAFAKKYAKNIDGINCCLFLQDAEKYWVNILNKDLGFKAFVSFYLPDLLCGEYLEFCIPFLEIFLSKKVTKLDLDGTYIKRIPRSLLLLDGLECLDLSNGKTGCSRIRLGLKLIINGAGHIVNDPFNDVLLLESFDPPQAVVALIVSIFTKTNLRDLMDIDIPEWLTLMPSLKTLRIDLVHQISFDIREGLEVIIISPDGILH